MCCLSAGVASAGNAVCPAELAASAGAQPAARQELRLDCRLDLRPGSVVRQPLVFEGSAASGSRLDCHGGLLDGGDAGRDMLIVRSRRLADGSWDVPEDIVVDNCRIRGSIRIIGMGSNGQGALLVPASRRPGYVEQLRAAAPRNIRFQRLSIEARQRIPFYVSPGASGITLAASTISGKARLSVYLDAESDGNVIEGNVFTAANSREAIAVDASSGNWIIGNRFQGDSAGGIFLYRNCGEGGTVRHTTPSGNRILNNVFVYGSVWPFADPAVFVGSRDGKRRYCSEDDGFPFGSSADDRDFARDNVVAENRVIGRSADGLFVQGSEVNRPNFLLRNERVEEAPPRAASCFLGEPLQLLPHGSSIDTCRVGRDGFTRAHHRCDNGRWRQSGACS